MSEQTSTSNKSPNGGHLAAVTSAPSEPGQTVKVSAQIATASGAAELLEQQLATLHQQSPHRATSADGQQHEHRKPLPPEPKLDASSPVSRSPTSTADTHNKVAPHSRSLKNESGAIVTKRVPAPVIHTNGLAASSKLLYVSYPQVSEREMNPSHSSVLAARFRVEPAIMIPQFEVLNLEITSSTAALTWNLSLLPPATVVHSQELASKLSSQSPSESTSQQDSWLHDPATASRRYEDPRVFKRDTIRVTPTLNGRLSQIEQLRRKQRRDEGVDDESVAASGDTEHPRRKRPIRLHHKNHDHLSSKSDDELSILDDEEQEPSSSTKRPAPRNRVEGGDSTTAAPSEASDDPPEPESFTSRVTPTPTSVEATIDLRRNRLAKSEDSRPAVDLMLNDRLQLSRIQNLSLPNASGRRPPMRSASSWSDPVRATPANSTSLLAGNSAVPIPRRLRPDRHQQNATDTQPTAAPAKPASAQRSSAAEPHVIKLPSVPLNRITQAATIRATPSPPPSQSTTTTTQRPRLRLATGGSSLVIQPQRSGKSMMVDASLADLSSTADPSVFSSTTKAPTTGAPTTTTTAPPTTTSGPNPTTTTRSPVMEAHSPTTERPASSISTTTSTTTTTTTSTTTTTAKPSILATPLVEEAATKSVSVDGGDSLAPNKTMTPSPAKSVQLPASLLVTKSALQTSTSSRPIRAETIGNEPDPTKAANNQELGTKVSNWMVRLRKFASNEVDIVKVLVNNLDQMSLQGNSNRINPQERKILFKDLDPASAYEICIESASPNQHIADRHQILNANHFLKCHDASDVELSPSDRNNNNEATFRRQDMSRSRDVDGGNSGLSGELLPQASNSQAGDKYERKMKSLCREFFTPPADSSDVINFGSSEHLSASTGDNKSSDSSASGLNSRRPKSLAGGGALKSHMELLEINDLTAINGGNYLFQMTSSRNHAKLMPSQSSNSHQVDLQNLSSVSLDTRQVLSSSNPHQNYLHASILPIVGCVFALIFLVTLINILLNSINCWSTSSTRRRQRRLATHSTNLSSSPILGNQLGSSILGGKSGHLNGSYGSERSTTASQTRFVVVGKDGEPYGSTSAYFDVPAARMASNTNDRLSSSSSGESSSACGKQSSSYLISSAAMFPLGPSFEGDEKHNADMVGLARRNYDNFINHIYNEQASTLSKDNDRVNMESSYPDNSQTVTKQYQHARHLHHNQRHLMHQHQHHQRLSSPPIVGKNVDARPPSQDDDSETFSASPSPSGVGARRQRIRFDKINPIYNMDSLYARPRKTHRLSSFGHANPTLEVDTNCDGSPMIQLSSGSSAGSRLLNQSHDGGAQTNQQYEVITEGRTPDCSLCSPSTSATPCHELSPSNCCDNHQHSSCVENKQEELVFSSPGGQDQVAACGPSELCGTARQPAYFKCCLDRQKQRIQEQQQQLELVMSKSGSLIPQPFINPAVAADLRSAEASAAAESEAENSLVEGHERPREQVEADNREMDQRDLLVFGEKQHESEKAKSTQPKPSGDSARSAPQPPAPPPEPPRMPADESSANEGRAKQTSGSGGKLAPLVQVNPMATMPTRAATTNGQTATGDRRRSSGVDEASETINKSDFALRREQLASKLTLQPK